MPAACIPQADAPVSASCNHDRTPIHFAQCYGGNLAAVTPQGVQGLPSARIPQLSGPIIATSCHYWTPIHVAECYAVEPPWVRNAEYLSEALGQLASDRERTLTYQWRFQRAQAAPLARIPQTSGAIIASSGHHRPPIHFTQRYAPNDIIVAFQYTQR